MKGKLNITQWPLSVCATTYKRTTLYCISPHQLWNLFLLLADEVPFADDWVESESSSPKSVHRHRSSHPYSFLDLILFFEIDIYNIILYNIKQLYCILYLTLAFRNRSDKGRNNNTRLACFLLQYSTNTVHTWSYCVLRIFRNFYLVPYDCRGTQILAKRTVLPFIIYCTSKRKERKLHFPLCSYCVLLYYYIQKNIFRNFYLSGSVNKGVQNTS